MLETPENEGSEGQKRTKTSILCSKSQKTRVSKAKKAQKWSFCAREEGGVAPGREEIGIGKHNRRDAYRKRGLLANHRARFKNISS